MSMHDEVNNQFRSFILTNNNDNDNDNVLHYRSLTSTSIYRASSMAVSCTVLSLFFAITITTCIYKCQTSIANSDTC